MEESDKSSRSSVLPSFLHLMQRMRFIKPGKGLDPKHACSILIASFICSKLCRTMFLVLWSDSHLSKHHLPFSLCKLLNSFNASVSSVLRPHDLWKELYLKHGHRRQKQFGGGGSKKICQNIFLLARIWPKKVSN